jgi:hypothetical protein
MGHVGTWDNSRICFKWETPKSSEIDDVKNKTIFHGKAYGAFITFIWDGRIFRNTQIGIGPMG